MVLFIIVGFYIVSYRTESQIRALVDEDSIRHHHISGFIGAYIANAFNDLNSIVNETETRNAINSTNPETLKSLQKSLLVLAQRNPVYDQVRWIDETGQEKIRISLGENAPYVESRQDLQDKSHRYYFKAANSLALGELYASKIDLNVEHGKIEVPIKPMLRVATPVMDSEGNRRGIIIINILMSPVFKAVRYLEQTGQKSNIILLNQQGEVIYGSIQIPEMQKNNQPLSNNLSTVYPDVWEEISGAGSGYLVLSDGIWTWEKVSSFGNLIGFKPYRPWFTSDIDEQLKGEFSLVFVVQRQLGFLLDMNRSIRVSTFTWVFAALIVYGSSLYFFLSGSRRARRAELETKFARINADSMARLKEHEERFRRLVESSSIGQLVVNSDGEIEISNATVEQMLGYERYELIGAKVESLLPTDKRKDHIAFRDGFMQDPRARKMGEGRELVALRKDGRKIPVEVGLNPYSEQGRVMVLVNVIDLSNREIQK
jgi:PAS domain S-box-containing protein